MNTTTTIDRHTPGPWNVSRHATPDYAPQYGVWSEEDGKDLAIVKGAANAKLIAAAPDLVHTLEIIRANAAESPEWIRKRIDAVLDPLKNA
jgi:hypothetical protein